MINENASKKEKTSAVKISKDEKKTGGENNRIYLERSLTSPQDKTKNNPYQKEFLSYVDGFDKGIINNDPTDLFPMTNCKNTITG